MRLTSLAVLLFLSFSAYAAEPSSYSEASQAADAQDDVPAIRTYLVDTVKPFYMNNYGPVVKACFASVDAPDNTPFSFVATIESDGKVAAIYSDRTTNIFICLRESLLKGQFPIPPKSPVYYHVRMRFNGMSSK